MIQSHSPVAPWVRRGIALRTVLLCLAVGALLASGPQVLAQAAVDVSGSGSETYIVRPGDVLTVWVWPDTELSGEYPVEETGLLHLPVVGAVAVGGERIGEVRDLLRARFGEALKSPVVTVTPHFPVSVIGAVQRPGVYPVTPTHGLFDVITLAGGLAVNADRDDVYLVRDGERISLDVEALLESGADMNLRLQSGDRIVVPRSRFNLDARDVLTALQTLAIVLTIWNRLEQ